MTVPFRAIVARLPIKNDRAFGSFKLLIKSRVLLALIQSGGGNADANEGK